jgi:hypothetical protein
VPDPVDRPYRRTYVRSTDTGLYRHPLALGALTFIGFYGALSTTGPLQVAVGSGCAIAFVTYVWRMVEEDRRAVEVEWKAAAPSPEVRPMETVQASRSARTVRVGRVSMTRQEWQDLGKAAMKNGGVITRDVMKAANLSRDVYSRAGEVQEELVALNFATPHGRSVRLVPRGVEFVHNPSPLPRPTVRELERA